MSLTYKKSIVVFRHGSRYPSGIAFKTFQTNKDVVSFWTLPDGKPLLEDLNEAGSMQCEELGKWTRKYLDEKSEGQSFALSNETIKWRSSAIERVKKSGKQFWVGFLGEDSSDFDVQEIPYEAIEGDETPAADYIFRTWDSNKEYKKWAANLLKSEKFIFKATENSGKLDEIIDALSLAPFRAYPKPAVLFGMTFAREMVDCERYQTTDAEKPLETTLTEELKQNIDELSLWCWDQRFFGNEFSDVLGVELKKEIFADMTDDGVSFSVYSGHDYTLLILLSALGVSSYEILLSFAAFIVFDVYEKENEDGSKQLVYSVSLNPTPFEEDQTPVQSVSSSEQTFLPASAVEGDIYFSLGKQE